jgi:hypothetical protein
MPGHEWAGDMRRSVWSSWIVGWVVFGGSGGVEESLDAPEAHAVGSGEGGGGGAVAISGDQLSDVALPEALARAPRTIPLGLGAHPWPANATV